MRRNWHWRAVALGTVAVLALGACGGDDDDDDASGSGSEPTEEAADGDSAAFCDDAVAADQSIAALNDGAGDPAAVETAMAAVSESAPDELSDAIATMVAEAEATLSEPPAEDGPPPIPSEEYFTAAVEVGDYMADNCGYNNVDVTAVNYEFSEIPEEVPAGKALIRLSNDGTEFHEVVLIRLPDGEERSLDELLALPEEEAGALLEDTAAFAFAPPENGNWTTADLEAGRYVAICFIPVGTTPDVLASGAPPEDTPPHFMEGMVTELTVS